MPKNRRGSQLESGKRSFPVGEQVLTVKPVAERLNLSVPSIYRLAEVLQAVRVSKRGLRFTEEARTRFMASSGQPAVDDPSVQPDKKGVAPTGTEEIS